MAHHARIEEVSDSEPEDMDPSQFDPQNIARMMSVGQPGGAGPSTGAGFNAPLEPFAGKNNTNVQAMQAEVAEKSKRWQCLYPVYFDASRTRAEGRRVGKELAVASPLARDIAEAVNSLGLVNVLLDPGKTHPKDWSNPGRVKVELKDKDGKLKNPQVKNSEPPPPTPIFALNDLAIVVSCHSLTLTARAPPLQPHRRLPQAAPHDGGVPHEAANQRLTPAKGTQAPGRPARLEDQPHRAAPLARPQRRRRQREPVQGHDG